MNVTTNGGSKKIKLSRMNIDPTNPGNFGPVHSNYVQLTQVPSNPTSIGFKYTDAVGAETIRCVVLRQLHNTSTSQMWVWFAAYDPSATVLPKPVSKFGLSAGKLTVTVNTDTATENDVNTEAP